MNIQLTLVSLIYIWNVISVTTPTRKDHILVEAARLFRELGFKASSMRDIAGAVGMEAASLYNHISSKQELLETICMTIADAYLKTITYAETVPPSGRKGGEYNTTQQNIHSDQIAHSRNHS